MSATICPIVEGHGDLQAVPLLLRRIFREILGAVEPRILAPIRRPRSQLVQREQLIKAVELASAKIRQDARRGTGMVLVLIDADHDLPCVLAPQLSAWARASTPPNLSVSVVLANVEFETWFVASAASLAERLDLSRGGPPDSPEGARLGKGWIQDRVRQAKYSETVDQPAFAAIMDLAACRRNSPSFDKLCRDVTPLASEIASPS